MPLTISILKTYFISGKVTKDGAGWKGAAVHCNGTEWYSAYTDSTGTYKIEDYGDRAVIQFSKRNYGYRIEVSSDSLAWTVADDNTKAGITDQVRTDRFSAVARYVRIMFTSLTGTQGYAGVREFEVFGK